MAGLGASAIVLLLVVGVAAADAAPVVSPGNLPGRERYRFEPSPLDRFMQPSRPAKPLLRWDCDTRSLRRAKPRSRQFRGC
ncbi:MAG TPA: hypothetical protein VI010_02035 [Xanthobacteraceae bacterium]|jgi:hypothetical protein